MRCLAHGLRIHFLLMEYRPTAIPPAFKVLLKQFFHIENPSEIANRDREFDSVQQSNEDCDDSQLIFPYGY